jgi:hypothetical protein
MEASSGIRRKIRKALAVSDYRVRQARIAGAVFGYGVYHYPPTREGFKAYWLHARVYQRISHLPNASSKLMPPFLDCYRRNQMVGNRRGYVYPDRVRNLDEDFKMWSFRWHSIWDVAIPAGKVPVAERLTERFGLRPSSLLRGSKSND